MSAQLKAFVLMPFHPEFKALYLDVIKPSLEEVGYDVARADDLTGQKNILKHIIQSINDADLIVAELTTSNANVLYELGFAHALDKPTVMLTQSMDDVPFDLQQYSCTVYSKDFHRIGELKRRLSEIGARWRDGNITFGNPRSDFLASPRLPAPVRPDSVAGENAGAAQRAGEAEDEEAEEGEAEQEGLLDFAVQGHEALERTVRFLQTLTEDTQKLGEVVTISGEEAEQLAQNPEPGSASRMHKTALRVAAAMNAYSEHIESSVPEFEESVRNQFQGFTSWIELAEPSTPEDMEALRGLRNAVAGNLAANASSLEATQGFRESVSALRKARISKALSGASRRTRGNLDRYIAVLQEIQPLGQRLLRAIDEKLDSTS